MASEAELLALADKVERYEAAGPYDIARERERELNEAIAVAIGLPRTVKVGHPVLGNDRTIPARVIAYTASLDAAMTLVPKGHGWVSRSTGYARVYPMDKGDYEGFAATPALALSAAALKARAATMGGGDD